MRVLGSIRWRLTLAGAVTITLALVVAGLVLGALFGQQLTRLATQDLDERAVHLMSGLNPNDAQTPRRADLGGDPRYQRPYSGYYWQVSVADRAYRSQSLWDATLDIGAPPPVGSPRLLRIPGPDGQDLLVQDRLILLGPDQTPARISVAMDMHSMTEARDLFGRNMVIFLTVLGGLLIGASFLQVAVGLRPFRHMRHRISRVNSGEYPRLGDDLPTEVRPLAQSIDDLLDERDARIRQARHRAADLAHTLKTPLQAILGEAGRLRTRGQGTSADAIETVVMTVRNRIDYELARDRIAGRGISDPSTVARDVADVLRRTARGHDIAIDVEIEPIRLQIEPNDLTEALGSLMENALDHTRTRIRIWAEPCADYLALHIEDDGPGVSNDQLDHITERGTGTGSGLGLSLAREIAEANGGKMVIENLPEGFRASLLLVRAQAFSPVT